MDDLNKLKVFPYVSAVFADYTAEAWDYSRDNFTIALASTSDFLYLGYSKAFNSIYVEMATANAVARTMQAEYWNGTAWTALPLLVEDTKFFTRSGFIKWAKPTDWEDTEINSETKFFVRLSMTASAATTAIFAGINLVFADDNDLKSRRLDIYNFLPKNEDGATATSHILAHVSAREEILQYLSREGIGKRNSTTGLLSELNQWDLHNFDQIRKAAISFALYFIFDNLSDTKDDLYDVRAQRHFADATKYLEVFLFSYDQNDDGAETSEESMSGFEIRLRR